MEETGREEWLAQYEVAADAFRKANGDLLRELVQAGMDSGEFALGDAVLVEQHGHRDGHRVPAAACARTRPTTATRSSSRASSGSSVR